MTDTERIQEILRSKNLTNAQFSTLTGISAANLSHILGGRTNPSLTILRAVVKGFPDLEPAWVLMGEGPMFREGGTAARGGDDSTPPVQGFGRDVAADASHVTEETGAPMGTDEGDDAAGLPLSADGMVDLFDFPKAVSEPSRMAAGAARRDAAAQRQSQGQRGGAADTGMVADTGGTDVNVLRNEDPAPYITRRTVRATPQGRETAAPQRRFADGGPRMSERGAGVSEEAARVRLSDVVRETLEQVRRPQRKIIEVRIFFDDGTYESFGAGR